MSDPKDECAAVCRACDQFQGFVIDLSRRPCYVLCELTRATCCGGGLTDVPLSNPAGCPAGKWPPLTPERQ